MSIHGGLIHSNGSFNEFWPGICRMSSVWHCLALPVFIIGLWTEKEDHSLTTSPEGHSLRELVTVDISGSQRYLYPVGENYETQSITEG